MRAVVQRVLKAEVEIEAVKVSQTGRGLLVLAAVESGDTQKDVLYIRDKLLGLRVFDDAQGVMNLSVCDMGYEIMLVSQFTLMGDVRKGRRPDYFAAEKPQRAKELYEELKALLCAEVRVSCGVFQADMQVSLVNDGPVTILLDSRKRF